MLNSKKDKVVLLKALRNLVKENLEFGAVNIYMESDVGEVMTDLCDRKRLRNLKKLQRATDNWMKELEVEHRIKNAEQRNNNEKLQNFGWTENNK
jgi:hypothetical protein